jgi:hypothetical protein
VKIVQSTDRVAMSDPVAAAGTRFEPEPVKWVQKQRWYSDTLIWVQCDDNTALLDSDTQTRQTDSAAWNISRLHYMHRRMSSEQVPWMVMTWRASCQ